MSSATTSNKMQKTAAAMPRAASYPEMSGMAEGSSGSSSIPHALSTNDLRSRAGDREEELELMIAMMLSQPERNENGKKPFAILEDGVDVPETPSTMAFFSHVMPQAGTAQ
eukprot:5155449-Prymnesium_polylepis.2